MARTERRVTPRFKLRTPLSFHRMEAPSEGQQQARAINISTRGIFFATKLVMTVGEALEVLVEIPKRVTGVSAPTRRFQGRVTHIEFANLPEGTTGIGVQLLYYERDLAGVSG